MYLFKIIKITIFLTIIILLLNLILDYYQTFNILIFLLILISIHFILYIVKLNPFKIINSYNWIEIEAKVIEHKINIQKINNKNILIPVIKYKYKIKDNIIYSEIYSFNTPKFYSKFDVNNFLSLFEVNSLISVYYNPKNINESIIEKGNFLIIKKLILLFIIIFFIFFSLLLKEEYITTYM